MVGAAVVAVLGLAATVVGLWPGLVSAQLTGGGQAALFFAGLGLLGWGGTWLAVAAGREAPPEQRFEHGFDPDARTAERLPTLEG